MSQEQVLTKLPPHLVAAAAGDSVAALSGSPLPPGATSHAEAAVMQQKAAMASQAQVNGISGGNKKRRSKKRRSKKRRSKKSKASRKHKPRSRKPRRKTHKKRSYKRKHTKRSKRTKRSIKK